MPYSPSYISYRQSYAHHPAKKTRYGPGPSSSLGGGSGGASSGNGRFSIGGGGGGASEDQQGLLSSTHAAGDDGFFYDVDDGDAVIEMDVLPPRWADVSDEVTERLGDIARQSQALERLHQKHVLPVFGDDDEDDGGDNDSSAAAARRAEEAEIERLTQAITRGFHDCHRAIQRVERMVRENGTGSNNNSSQMMTRAEETMARNVQISLAARVQEASANFRKKQSAYLKSVYYPYIYIQPRSQMTLEQGSGSESEGVRCGFGRLSADFDNFQNSAACPASAPARPYRESGRHSPRRRSRHPPRPTRQTLRSSNRTRTAPTRNRRCGK